MLDSIPPYAMLLPPTMSVSTRIYFSNSGVQTNLLPACENAMLGDPTERVAQLQAFRCAIMIAARLLENWLALVHDVAVDSMTPTNYAAHSFSDHLSYLSPIKIGTPGGARREWVAVDLIDVTSHFMQPQVFEDLS